MSYRRLIHLCAMAAVVVVATSTSLRAQTAVPGIPLNLQVTAAGNTVTATWEPALTGGQVVNYVVVARNATGAILAQQSVPATTLSGSVASGVYFVSVRGENAAGAGSETAARAVTVGITGVPGMPTGVTVTGVGNVLRIRWNAPGTGGAVSNYAVTTTDAGGTVLRFDAGVGTEVVLARRDGTYTIVVRASNAQGAGPESLPVSTAVPLGGPPDAGAPGVPVGFAADVSGNVLSLSWGAPTAGGAPARYLVLQQNASGAVVGVFDMGTALSFIGPVPNGVYTLSIVAVNVFGGGLQSSVVTATVPSATTLVGAPTLVGTVSGSTVLFNWTPAAGPVASQYTLRASIAAGGPPIATLLVSGQTTQLQVDAVPPGTYFATVTGSNAFVGGLPSNTVTVIVAGAAVTRSTLNTPGLTTGLNNRFSQTNGGQFVSRVFDDFVLGPGATIGTIAWQGVYCTQSNSTSTPAPSATAFNISLHADVNGRPDTAQAIVSATVPLSQVNQTFAGSRVGTPCGNATSAGFAYYDYSLTLPSAVAVQGGTRYWLAIQAVNTASGSSWGWRGGAVDTRTTYQLSGSTLTFWDIDRAFSLTP